MVSSIPIAAGVQFLTFDYWLHWLIATRVFFLERAVFVSGNDIGGVMYGWGSGTRF
jgi:hypothetical protein